MTLEEALLVADYGGDHKAAAVVLAEEVRRLTADRDCRTCRHFRGTEHCHSVLRCVAGSSYQRNGVVQLWEAAQVDAGF